MHARPRLCPRSWAVAVLAALAVLLAPGIADAHTDYYGVCEGAYLDDGTMLGSGCYDWQVDPQYTGSYFTDNASADAAEPAPTPVAPALATWRNLYDWPNGHGYVGWYNASSGQPGAYGAQSALGGLYGLWLWPVGGSAFAYSNGNFVEWTYTAPGTTRLANAELILSYRNKLLAHHCIELGFRDAAGNVIAKNEHCKPVQPPDSQRQVNVALYDPQPNPTSKVLYVRIRVDCGGATTCSKHVAQLDPLSTGGYARLLSADMILVDDDNPVATPSGPFWDLGDDYSNGRLVYPLTVDASDAGAGIVQNWVERIGSGTLASGNAPCDLTHKTPALDNRICPQSFTWSTAIDTNPFPEGTNQFVAKSIDPANNVGASDSWKIYIDRTPPTMPSGFGISADSELGMATVSWNESVDPPLPDGVPGSGLQEYRVRYAVNGGALSEWLSEDDASIDVGGVAGGSTVAIEAQAVDRVGNTSASGQATLAVPTVSVTRGPVLTGQLVSGSGGGVAGDVSIAIAREDSGESPVATATTDGSGAFTLRLSPAEAKTVADEAIANAGWVNFDVVAGGNGLIYRGNVARRIALAGWSDGTGNPDPMTITLAAGSPGVTTAPTALRFASARQVIPCVTFNYKVAEADRYAIVGELHTAADMYGTFEYGQRADSTVQVGVSEDGKIWKIHGSVHVHNSRGSSREAAVTWRRRANFGKILKSEFHFAKYERHLACFGAPDIVDYVVKAKKWNGGTAEGADVSEFDHHCLDTYNDYALSFAHDTSQTRSSSKAKTWDGGADVFGAGLDIRSGFSKWVTTKWSFGHKLDRYWLCGNDAKPFDAKRVFAGG